MKLEDNICGVLKRNKIIIIALLLLVEVLGFGERAEAATYYMPDDCVNLQVCFGLMSGGDTLVIRDGVYENSSDNSIQPWNHPPVGNSSQYTKVIAEHPGGVIFGKRYDQNGMFRLSMNGDVYYWFEGIIWEQSINIYGTNFIKMFRCAVDNEDNVIGTAFGIASSENILLEECYAWGGGRYKFSAYESNKIIFRRCVARNGAINTTHGGRTEPIGFFAFYRTSNSEAQNCIAIDSDRPGYWIYSGLAGAFSNPNNAAAGSNNTFRGCIALNLAMQLCGIGAGYTNTLEKNIVGWDLTDGMLVRGQAELLHITLGQIDKHGTSGDGVVNVNNSIFYAIQDTVFTRWGGSVWSDYNVLYGNKGNYGNGISPGVHDYCSENFNAIDPLTGTPGNGIPALKYLPRIENGSDLKGAASDGRDIGATIIYKVGRDGTLWGEPGFNETTNKSLWPFPNEDIIKEYMKAYSYTGPMANGSIGTIKGDRGFCANGTGLYGGNITLTSYIWEYLGNPCPPEICAYGDNPPTRSNPSPTGNLSSDTTQTNISLETDVQAVCRYSNALGTNYSNMHSNFTCTNSTNHSTEISSLENGQSYTFYIRCNSSNGYVNDDDFNITFSISGHKADLSDDGIISMKELISFIARWKAGDGVSREEVEEARDIWFNGGVY